MKLAYHRPGREAKYIIDGKPGLEVKFRRSRMFVLDSVPSNEPAARYQDCVEFWNASPDSSGIDLIVQFVTNPGDYIAGKPDLRAVQPDHRLYSLFLGVVNDGDPPEPFLDHLAEEFPDLGPMVDKYLGTHNEFPEGKS